MNNQSLKNKVLRAKAYYFSSVGPVRKQNQDNLFAGGCANPMSAPYVSGRVRLETGSVQAVAVFDGMGGETDGEKASLMAAERLRRFAENVSAVDDRDSLRQAADLYYDEFLEALDDSLADAYAVCGTTCAGVLLQEGIMVPFWMGDSRVYLLRQGEFSLLTRDHSVAQQQIDSGLMTEAEARKTTAWHTLTAYMGQYEEKIALGDLMTLYPGDRILLCSDGITDAVEVPSLKDILQKLPEQAMAELECIANTKADDNCTAILICVEAHMSGRLLEQLGRAKQWMRSRLTDMR